MAILTKSEIDSVDKLAVVKQAVYVMQSIQHQQIFRFGCLGGRNAAHYSTAIRRLGQCGKYQDELEESWRYVAVCELAGRREETIEEAERELRTALLKPNGPYTRDGRRDRITDGERKRIVTIFRSLFGKQD